MRCISPLSIKHPRATSNQVRVVVPCGKCGSCLGNRRIDWSFRLKEEHRHSVSAWFLTLTLDPSEIQYSDIGLPEVRKRDIQLFLKRVRKEHQKLNKIASAPFKMPPVRYYAVGEYGTTTDRPHYHALLFNIHLETASRMDKHWKLGQIKMGPVTDATIHYTTKYHVNTKNSREVLDEDTGELKKISELRSPEFSIMSRRPGIGHQFIHRSKQWYHDNEFPYVVNNGVKQRIPRYYKGKQVALSLTEKQKEDLLKEMDKKFFQEMERLSKLEIENPFLYMETSLYHESKKVLKNAKNSLSL
ncbi:replication initiator protein [Microviridae sp.]|nr:replication initiator protein [Microviridae sp.]